VASFGGCDRRHGDNEIASHLHRRLVHNNGASPAGRVSMAEAERGVIDTISWRLIVGTSDATLWPPGPPGGLDHRDGLL